MDPTGAAGQGFSYVSLGNGVGKRNSGVEEEGGNRAGTSADLRKLTLDEARRLLRQHGVPKSEIDKLTRWQVVS